MVPKEDRHPHTWSPIPAGYGQQLTDLWNQWLEQHATAEHAAPGRQRWARRPAIPSRSHPHDWPKNCGREHYLADAVLSGVGADLFERHGT